MTVAKTLTNHRTRSASIFENVPSEKPQINTSLAMINTEIVLLLIARLLVNMASDAPAKSSTTTLELEGYVHQVSEIKTPSSGTRYFDFNIQQQDVRKRVVCFSSQKRDDLKHKQESKTLVKLLNVSPHKRKFDPNTQEYRLNNYSKVVATQRVPFPWKDISADLADASVKFVLDSCIPGDVVSLKAKVLHKSNEQSVYSYTTKTDLKKCDIIVADSTGTILITLWEDAIAKVNTNTSYNFKGLKVAFFNNKYLNTTSQTIVKVLDIGIQLSEEITAAAEEMKPTQKVHEYVSGNIIAADFSKVLVCFNYKSRLTATEDEVFLKCFSCNHTMLKISLASSLSANLVISDDKEQNLGSFKCSHAVLNSFFMAISNTTNYNINAKDVNDLTEDMISKTLQLLNKIEFQVCKDQKTITSMN